VTRRRRRDRRRAAGPLVLLAALAVAFLFWHGYLRFNYPSRARYPVRGVDVSHHQRAIDWARLRADGAEFAWLKASEGAGWRDSTFARNQVGAVRAGVVTGAYHYFTFCAPADAQARNFLAAAPPRPGPALPPAVDLEFGGNCAARPPRDSLIAALRGFLRPVEAAYGRAAVLYVTREFHDAYLAGSGVANPLWVRSIVGAPDYGGRWVIRQYGNRGRMDGVGTYVGLNAFSGSGAEFRRWTQPPPR
jgi:lysozyme